MVVVIIDERNSFLSIPCPDELGLIRNGYHSTKDKPRIL